MISSYRKQLEKRRPPSNIWGRLRSQYAAFVRAHPELKLSTVFSADKFLDAILDGYSKVLDEQRRVYERLSRCPPPFKGETWAQQNERAAILTADIGGRCAVGGRMIKRKRTDRSALDARVGV